MIKIKRLYTFVIQEFFPLFLMTFFICLFIFLMQFLWQQVEELVGKGLDILIVIELFFYAALNLIPMVLPLAILLASIMTFGNMGERLELLAIKASGVSLLKIMRPLIIFIIFISVSSFFFQNIAMPRIAVKFRTLLLSVKRKSPELDIPEGAFYSGIRNYSLYVEKKNRTTGMLYEVMIYSTVDGFDNMSVFVCDSAHISIRDEKTHLTLNLYSGQRFANFTQNSDYMSSGKSSNFVPYSRENFKRKTVLVPFNDEFTRMEEDVLKDNQIAKNLASLQISIDSMNRDLFAKNRGMQQELKNSIFGTSDNLPPMEMDSTKHLSYKEFVKYQTEKDYLTNQEVEQRTTETLPSINFDSLINTFSEDKLLSFTTSAIVSTEDAKNKYLYNSIDKLGIESKIRRHAIEWHQKFALSLACLIFFFIGVPLGAIIRKGGMGMPIVLSISLFLIYYIINTTGYKMARDNVWYIWQGAWFSSFLLLPLGMFLTYKAMNDSELFNTEAYAKNLRKLLRLKPKPSIATDTKIVDLKNVPALAERNANEELVNTLQAVDIESLKNIARNYQEYGYDIETQQIVMSVLKEKGAKSVDLTERTISKDAVDYTYTTFLSNSKLLVRLFFAILCSGVALAVFTNLVEANTTLLNLIATCLQTVFYLAIAAYFIVFSKAFMSYTDFYILTEKKTKKQKNKDMLVYLIAPPLVYMSYGKQMKKDKAEYRK